MGALALALGLPHSQRHRAALARLRFCLPVRLRLGVRCAGAADLRRPSWSATQDLANAVALNSTSFNAARMIGPAVAGLVIAVGRHRLGIPGQRRLVLRRADLAVRASRHPRFTPSRARRRTARQPAEGFHYVWARPDLRVDAGHAAPDRHLRPQLPDLHLDHGGAACSTPTPRGFGLLSSMMAVGTMSGALLGARPRTAAVQVPAGRRRLLRPRLRIGRARADLLAVRCRAGRHRRRRADLHEYLQQPDAAVDRAGDARPGDGDPPCDRSRRNADRRSDRGLDRRSFGPRWSLGLAAAAGLLAALIGTYARQLLSVRTVNRSKDADAPRQPREKFRLRGDLAARA